MRYFHQGWFRQRFQQQFQFLKRQFLQDDALPFGDALSETMVAKALTDNAVDWIDRIYSPLVTLWIFLGQVLSQDHSCRAAVARLIAHRISRGQRCPSQKLHPVFESCDIGSNVGPSLLRSRAGRLPMT